MSQRAIALLALAAALGCGGSDREELTRRVDQLEGRLAALEQRVGSLATVDDLHEQVAGLERRIAAVAASARPTTAGPPSVPSGSSGLSEALPLPVLKELSAEYREKLAAVDKRYAADPTSPQRLREIHELRTWFYNELRAAQAEAKAWPPPGAEAGTRE